MVDSTFVSILSLISILRLQDEDLAIFASARVAINYFVQQMDKAQVIVRRLCGEVELPGFARFREEYERRQREVEALDT